MSSTPILGIPQIAPTQVNKVTTINDALLAFEGATQDQTTISLAGADVTLTAFQFTHFGAFLCSGAAVARSLIIPTTKRVFVCKNTGSHDITVGYTAGTGVTVASGSGAIIQTDGSTIALLGSGGPGPTGATGPAGPISTLVAGVGLGGITLTANGTINADWHAGTVAVIGTGLALATGTVTAAFGSAGLGLDINAGVVSANWQQGTVTALGAGMTVIAGTLQATAFGGTMTQLVAGAGLAGGTITNAGTVSLAAIASNDLLANTAGTSAVPVATSLSGVIDAALGATQGDILYRSATAWTVLAPGTSGNFLQTGGAAANPSWQAVSGATGGTLTQVVAGTGLSGGTITATGTISLAAIANHDLLANTSGGSAAPVATTLTALVDDAIGSTQGDVLYRSATAWTVLAPGTAGQRLSSGGAAANPAWVSDPYVVAGFISGTLSASQVCLFHKFAQAVVFPSNFGAAVSGATSGLSAMALATGSTAILVQKCPSGTDPSVGGNWTNVGTVTVSAGGHSGAFTTSGTVAFASGDKVRAVGPSSADATFGSFSLTLAGDR